MKLTLEIELQPNMEQLLIDKINEYCQDWFGKTPVLKQCDVSGSASSIGEPQQIADWKKKAEKWEALGKEIEKFYCNSEGEYDEENPEEQGDLCTIGEVAACAYGWL